LEPLSGYLSLCEKLYTEGVFFAEGWNFGPDDSDAKNVEWIIAELCRLWGDGAAFGFEKTPQPHEASYLKLDCSKAKSLLGWYPQWDVQTALQSIVDWNKSYLNNVDMRKITIIQIEKYFAKEK
jgi:CDP-glucose 4,6-dehydratase